MEWPSTLGLTSQRALSLSASGPSPHDPVLRPAAPGLGPSTTTGPVMPALGPSVSSKCTPAWKLQLVDHARRYNVLAVLDSFVDLF